MISLDSILEIVDSYEITESMKDIVLRNTLQRQNSFEDYASAYTYISNIVDYLQKPFHERKNVSLDAKIGNSDVTYAHFYGKNDKLVFEKDEQYRRDKILEYSSQYLADRFNSKSLDLFNTLVLNTRLEPEEYKTLINSLDEQAFSEISRRLDLFKTKLYDKNQDSISWSNLEITCFNPFKIRFKHRKYEGNPLKFFKENQSLYKDMSRKDLERFDSGLARHLRYNSQMERAIPQMKITNSLPQKEIQRIISSYEESWGCPKLASEKLGFNRGTIKKYWGQEGLKLYKVPYRFNKDPLSYFKKNLHKFKGISRADLNKNYPGFYNYLKKCGQLSLAIPTKRFPNKLSNSEIKFILNLYNSVNGSLAEAQRLTGYSTSVISKYWQEAKLYSVKVSRNFNNNPLAYFNQNKDRYKGMTRGDLSVFDGSLYQSLLKSGQIDLAIPKNTEPPKIKKEGLEKILGAYVLSEGVVKRAAEITGFDPSTVSKYWDLAGFEALGHNLNKKEVAEIISSYTLYSGNISKASLAIGRARSTVAKYWADEGLISNYSKVHNNPKTINKIVKSYKKFNGNASLASEELGFTIQTVIRYWRRNNLPINNPGRHINAEGKQEILDAFVKFNGKVSVAAKELGRDYSTVLNYWINAGLKKK